MIDLTILDSLQKATDDAQEPSSPQATQETQEANKPPETREYNLAVSRMQARRDKEDEARANAQELYQTYQEHQRKAGDIRAQLIKGTQAGENIVTLYLLAVEAIGYMTGDGAMLTEIKKNIEQVYAYTLGDPEAIAHQITEAQSRLQRLQNRLAEIGAHDPGRPTVLQAIRRHQERIEQLARYRDQEGNRERQESA